MFGMGGYLVIGVIAVAMIGSVAGYIYYLNDRVTTLTTNVATITHQADDLQKKSEQQDRDFLAIRRAQDAYNDDLAGIRSTAQKAVQAVRQQRLAAQATANPRAAEQQVNQDSQAMLQRLEDVTHATP